MWCAKSTPFDDRLITLTRVSIDGCFRDFGLRRSRLGVLIKAFYPHALTRVAAKKHRGCEMENTQTQQITNASNVVSIQKMSRRGRKPEYHDPRLIDLIFQCWLERERMCAKRLVIQLESWLQEFELRNGALPNELRTIFLDISAATIDRVLKPRRDMWYSQNGRMRA